VSNTVPSPTVSVSAPTAGSTVSGVAVGLAASTTGVGVLGVQFRVDGVNVGVEDTTVPYGVSWDSTTVSNGSHQVLAVARTAGTPVTSVPVSVTVSNVAPPSGGLVPNPSLETASGSAPASWLSNYWGSLNASFSYPSSGGHSGSRFVRVDVTSYSSGDAKWYFSPQAVSAGVTYTYSDWYRANVSSQLVAAVGYANGSTTYHWLGDVGAASSWTQIVSSFVAPGGATNMTVFHLMPHVGWLETDDHSLTAGSGPPPPGGGFNRALVSLTFDDGWESHATTAPPILQQHAMNGTFYVLSGELDQSPYMSTSQLLSLQAAGNEIAAHTVSHPHLPALSSAQQDYELQQCRTTLEAITGRSVSNFATPYGEYDSVVLNKIRGVYGSHRTVNTGYNTRAVTDVYELKVQNVFNTTTRAEVESWIAAAQSQNAWLILVFHNIVDNPDTYDSSPAMLEQYLQAIQSSGIAVRTMASSLSEITPQL
jgi:peptidoglycan/xylan/chitin deacetylase (PgdA/CDA1 family)